MTFTTAAELGRDDLVFAGHGYGEAPAFVLSANRFTTRTVALVLTSSDGHSRHLTRRHQPAVRARTPCR